MSILADAPAVPHRHPKREPQTGSDRLPTRNIPSLDGLRALSVTCVFLTHLPGTVGFPTVLADVTGSIGIGQYGVRAFFIISGLLITTLLINEQTRNGRINLAAFYFRRTFRILPASYAYLLIVAMLAVRGEVLLNSSDVAHGLSYTVNYDTHRSWVIAHYWSLSAEEQFYLLWPAVMLLLGRRRAGWAAAAFICVAPLIRVAELHLLPPRWDGMNGKTFETTADAIAVGCLLALWRDQLWQWRWYRLLLKPSVLFVLMAAAVFAATEQEHPNAFALVGHTVMNIALVLVIDYAVRNPNNSFGRLLNSRPLMFIGLVSYSLYLWQQLFMHRHVDAWWTRFPINVPLTLGAALLSYYAVERPMLRIRERLSKRMEAAHEKRFAAAIAPA